MRDISCTLLHITTTQDKIGNEIEEIKKKVIPIIKIEDVYANEYYQANQQGFKASLRIKISSLNYEDEKELIYMNKIYSVIRTQESTADELVLICERKVKDVKNNKTR